MTTTQPAQTPVMPSGRSAYFDNLKVLMVIGVIVAHVTFAWTTVGNWVFKEEPLPEPALTLATMLAVICGLFGLALFFLVAGRFTPSSFRRKGPLRFLGDRLLRLGVPMAFFVIFLSPVVEYVDDDSKVLTRNFVNFTLEIWWPPAPGPTWFLGVLLAFSFGYALVRWLRPADPAARGELTWRPLLIGAVVLVVASYFARMGVSLGEEKFRLALGQSPAWVLGFVLGCLGGERGWFDAIPPRLARGCRWLGLGSAVTLVLVVGTVTAIGGDAEAFNGRGTWQSLLAAFTEAGLVIGMSVWLLDLFRRRFDRQGPLLRELSRGAFAAFLVHQVVLVGVILATHRVTWPPVVEFLLSCVVGVALSFGVASLVVRVPWVRRFV